MTPRSSFLASRCIPLCTHVGWLESFLMCAPALKPALDQASTLPLKRWFASFGAFNMPSTVVPAVQELHASRADMATVVEGFFNGTFSAKGIERDRLVVRHIPSCSSSYLQLTHLTIHCY